ncbi:MAG: acetamidase/formamidase family protein [Thermofilaceae archaeon]|nr:acetamidase/formamidase family protein [Thermofilaceae archaeon]MDW8004445.1 acetamidase/formamidase family protein [Thermofilaceae archaeon]
MPAESEIVNDVFTNGVIGPHSRMLGPVADGGRIRFVTTPGCWGPMLTPTLRGGHEVNMPVAVEGVKVGDAVAIQFESLKVLSKAASSGVDRPVEGAFVGDPYVAKRCPVCREPWPQFEVIGTGGDAVKCKKCGSPASPFRMVQGYTMVFDENRKLGVTVGSELAKRIAERAREYASLPRASAQVSVLTLGVADMPGVATRLRPFLGQLGSTPAVDIPDSHNAGDFGAFLINAPHPYSITREQYERDLTDGHLDVDSVRPGSIVIVPAKVEGAGIYAGDAHGMQGDGEVAGHTTDITAEALVRVEVVKNLSLEGPILLPPEEDLPPLAKPWRKDEWMEVRRLAKELNVEVEESAPVQVIGSGPTINEAAQRGFERAARLFKMSVEEVRNRVTITGAVEIGRLPGIVQVSLQAPLRLLEKLGVADLVVKHYGLPY